MRDVLREESGYALLITLLVTVLLTVLVFEFFYEARVYMLQSEANIARIRAHYLARSGVYIRKKMLEDDLKDSNYDGFDEDWAVRLEALPLPAGTITLDVVDEESKFNINLLVRNNGGIDEKAAARFRRLLEELRLDSGIADRIIWFMQDREDTNYDIGDISELREVDGLEREEIDTLKDFITTDSSGMVNINTASKEVILSLSQDISSSLADSILSYRADTPFENKTDLKKIQGMSDNILNTFFDAIDVKSSFFDVTSKATVDGMVRNIDALIKRSGESAEIEKWREY